MVEIFTVAGGPGGASARSVTNDVRLTAPSDVYFGSGVAGIAYYEKSGADLRVILLDGQEVLVRDFFVIGPAGEYSRLLDGGAAGEVEITGLLAPEPFVPPTEPAAVAEAEKAEEAQPMAEGDSPQGDEIVVDLPGGEPAADDAAPVAGGGGGGVMTIAGIGLDRLLFAAASIPVSVELLDDDPPATASLAVAAPETGDAEGAPENAGTGAGETDAGAEAAPEAAAGDAVPPEGGDLGALIAGLLQDDGLLGGLLFGAEGPGDILAEDSAASSFLDVLFAPPAAV